MTTTAILRTPDRGILWFAAINKWSDQTGTAHIQKDFPDGTRPACGKRPYGMGVGYPSAMETNCMECGMCAKIARKLGATTRTPAKPAPHPAPAAAEPTQEDEDKCESCEGRGWLLIESGNHGHQIQACDCGVLPGDDEAAEKCQAFIDRALKAGIT